MNYGIFRLAKYRLGQGLQYLWSTFSPVAATESSITFLDIFWDFWESHSFWDLSPIHSSSLLFEGSQEQKMCGMHENLLLLETTWVLLVVLSEYIGGGAGSREQWNSNVGRVIDSLGATLDPLSWSLQLLQVCAVLPSSVSSAPAWRKGE